MKTVLKTASVNGKPGSSSVEYSIDFGSEPPHTRIRVDNLHYDLTEDDLAVSTILTISGLV